MADVLADQPQAAGPMVSLAEEFWAATRIAVPADATAAEIIEAWLGLLDTAGANEPVTAVAPEAADALEGTFSHLDAGGPEPDGTGAGELDFAERRRDGKRTLVRHVGNAAAVVTLGVITVALSVALGPRLFGYETLLIRSGSMGSTAPTGSLVVAKWITAAQVTEGTVALLRDPRRPRNPPVLHRVIERSETDGMVTVRTKGDANAFADPGLQELPASVLTPVRVVPHVGRLIAATSTRAGWFGLIVFPASLLLAHFLVGTWAQPRRQP